MNFEMIENIVKKLAYSSVKERPSLAAQITQWAAAEGVFPASIARVYSGLAKGEIAPMTIPAINLRGMTYDLARAVWQVVLTRKAGPVIFELAPSEMSAGDQTAGEYAAMILAAACREGYHGPVFLQGDHFHIDSAESAPAIQKMCQEAISAGFYQIDLDAATLINHSAITPKEVQLPNANISASLTSFIRSIQPEGIHVTVGGEVGEIGSNNTTPEDLLGFMEAYLAALPAGDLGLDKISIQTGTRHGGIVQTDGSLAVMPLDLTLAKQLSTLAKKGFGIAGLVQHGASTLTMQQLSQLPENGVIEVHLATQIQNIVFDHPEFPKDLLLKMRNQLSPNTKSAEGDSLRDEDNQSDIQKFYNARWTAWGTFKHDLWEMPEANKKMIQISLQDWLVKLFAALRVEEKLPLIQSLYALDPENDGI
jgi:fructose/tagatose bisphosphate aldolase